MTFATSELVYRDLTGLWGSMRLFVGGKDVSYFRGIPAQIGSYQLTEPYSYGPADFALPQLTPFEVDQWGTGELKWMGNGKPVKLVQVDASGAKVRTVWRGFVSLAEVTNANVLLHCDGEASGQLALRIKTPDLFALKRHVGRKIFDAFKDCRIPLTPYLGKDIGVQTDGRGMTGTYLDYVDSLLAATIDTDGSQYTVTSVGGGAYHLGLKDTSTVDFSAFVGADGVDIDLSDDLSERPNTIYGQGVAPDGLIWVNGRYPNVIQGKPPAYPMDDDSSFGEGTTDADTDSGSGITAMIYKLVGTGYLARRKQPGGYDSDVTDAISDLQDDANLPQTGDMDPDTWAALYDIGVTGYSLLDAYVAPLAQSTKVRKWNHTANGSLSERNPNYDPDVIQRDLYVDHGPNVEKSRAIRYSKGVLARAQQSPNWAGTITLTSDVFAGNYAHSDGDPTQMSRLDIDAGTNMILKHFDGNTQFHVSVVNVDSDMSVQLGVDTQARDAATLGQVIARNIESRSHPARQWLRQHRTDANVGQLQFSEVGGIVFNTVDCPANRWTTFEVFCGQAGSVSRVRVQTSDSEAAFALAITAEETTEPYWNGTVDNPLAGAPIDDVEVTNVGSGYTSAPEVVFSGGGGSGAAATCTVFGGKIASLTVTDHGGGYGAPPNISFSGGGGSGAKAQTSVTLNNKWVNGKLPKLIDDDRALLGAWGDAAQPCGYDPGSFSGRKGQATGDPITGLFLEDAGFDYHTFTDGSLFFAIYPDRDCKIKPQQVLWDVLDNGV